ncbi:MULTISPECIES: hypothetical protein [Spiribacter]|nr:MULTISPECIES: hypothetical protein [Spiribacter]
MSDSRYAFAQITMLVGLLGLPLTAAAYIGPGMGAGAIATVLGVFAAIFLAIFAVVYYPLKRLFRRMRGAPAQSEKTESSEDGKAE